jgi:lysophospholipase
MQLFPTPENQAPPGAEVSTVTTEDGITLRVMHALVSAPRGTIVICGGRGDFIERYFETMKDLMSRGYAIAAFDWRGQGLSQRLLPNRLRGFVKRMADYDKDLAAVMTSHVLPTCPGPYFALAHSTGGHILLRSLRTRTWFTRAVVTAPLLGLYYGRWPIPVAKALAHAGAWTGFGWAFLPGHKRGPLRREEFPGNPLTSDHRRFLRDTNTLEDHPELGVGGATYSWLSAVLASLRELRRTTPRTGLRCPTLIVAAGLDRVVNNEDTRHFAKAVPGVGLIVLRESMHEIMMERDEIRAQFLAAFEAFTGGSS